MIPMEKLTEIQKQLIATHFRKKYPDIQDSELEKLNKMIESDQVDASSILAKEYTYNLSIINKKGKK